MSIKVGDWVAFQVREIDHDGDFSSERGGNWMPREFCLPVTPPDPHAALKEAVIRDVIATVHEGFDLGSDLNASANALIDAQRPPSKYAGLRAAIDGVGAVCGNSTFAFSQLAEELTKLEAEERG